MSVNVPEDAWPPSVEPELAARIVDVIVKEGMLDRAAMKPGATLDELNFDSLEAVMVINGIEDTFDVEIGSDLQWGEARNLGDLVALLAEHVRRATPALES
ncbi:acyl carrier protein [Chelatococcus asaccharovorans]|uniref:Acyl carrier protein n=1 Tax=Chelatococcus asaccharovorans TaxID=28210 RepID=A0A2V3UK17_9HYPH|nr:acyl carrier protein [Chelatococcus asaccharovorans]MBS7706254.1 acyl carrier protein [Chelatococcus asaccharovorans]PXW65110.1 acyl carrier protein [Chelatococcus asaccharovorans]